MAAGAGAASDWWMALKRAIDEIEKRMLKTSALENRDDAAERMGISKAPAAHLRTRGGHLFKRSSLT